MSNIKLKNILATKTSYGVISKGIYIIDGEEYLIKGNSGEGKLEPYSEGLVSVINEILGNYSIPYSIMDKNLFKEVKVYNGCNHVSVCKKHENNLYQYADYLDTRDELRYYRVLEDYKDFGFDAIKLRRLFMTDALIGNKDRHLNNISLEYTNDKINIGPILDCGASLLYDVPENKLKIYDKNNIGPNNSKPFTEFHRNQIKIINESLGEEKIFKSITKDYFISEFIKRGGDILKLLSKKRKESIISYLDVRYDKYIMPYSIEDGKLNWK